MDVCRHPEMSMDLGAASFSDAVAKLGVMPTEVTVYCSHENACVAQKLRAEYRCEVVLLPAEILKSVDHWAVRSGNSIVWNPGA